MTCPDPPAPTRRSLLRAGAGLLGVAGLAGVSGCGLRLESDAPHVPFVPRQPYPGLALLTAERDRVRAARDAARAAAASAATATPLTPAAWRAWAAVHEADLAALTARLAAVGDDSSPTPEAETPSGASTSGVLSPGPTPSVTGGSPGPATSTPAPPAAAKAAESADLAAGVVTPALGSAATAPAADLAVLVRARVGRAAAARDLGVEVPGAPARPAVPGAVAARVLDLVRPVVYGLEVAAAQAAPARSGDARASVRTWGRVRDQLDELAGAAASPAPFAYRLPGPVTTPAEADRLAAQLLLGLARDLAAACAAVPGDLHALSALSGWSLDALTWRARWGAGPAPLA